MYYSTSISRGNLLADMSRRAVCGSSQRTKPSLQSGVRTGLAGSTHLPTRYLGSHRKELGNGTDATPQFKWVLN